MMIELVNTGTELMLGRVLNSHQQWLCRQLADIGHVVARQVAVADTAQAIEQAVCESLSSADLVITTGGLGPTSDDLTREVVARALGRKLREDPETLAQLKAHFARLGRAMPERTRVQALVPEGAIILPNRHGTAPGLALELSPNPFRQNGQKSWLVMLPGPRRELRPLFTDDVIPLLRRAFPSVEPFVCRILRTTGLGESLVQEKIAAPLSNLVSAGLELGYSASPGRVDVRLAAHGVGAEACVNEAETVVRSSLGPAIYGSGDERLEEVVIRTLGERKKTFAVAESCTGGCIAHRLTNVPGASAVFLAGYVTYSNEAKRSALGVCAATLDRHGAVSEAVAREMAEGARAAAGTDFAIAVTGIAGPTGGTDEKPVGTVFIALASSETTHAWRTVNASDRLTFKEVTSQQALEHLRRLLQSSQ